MMHVARVILSTLVVVALLWLIWRSLTDDGGYQ